MTDEQNFTEQIENEKNKNTVRCQFCNSLMLKPKSAKFVEDEFKLPLMHQKNTKTIEEVETETLKDFWIVDDMFTFENIGFSNTVQNTKFLTCADCDMGPVGYHNLSTKKSYIALKRVKHVPKN
uniref:Putative guanine nucleotide exchange factor n=1 Tax=Tabanus bromius TaxID=304241 RepID=A0A0K8TLE5_TABBR